jgi:hypothetical protein
MEFDYAITRYVEKKPKWIFNFVLKFIKVIPVGEDQF